MSIYTDMKPMRLMINVPSEGLSGEKKDNYLFQEDINIAIYKNNSFASVNTAKYQESTHNAITFCNNLEDGKVYKIANETSEYSVTDFNTSGRRTTLLLKRIDFNG